VTLTAKDVAEITRLLEQSSFDELYLELDGVKLSLKRNGAGGRTAGGGGASTPPAWSSPGAPGVSGAPGAAGGVTSEGMSARSAAAQAINASSASNGAPLPATSAGATGSLIAATSLGAAAPSGASAALGSSAAAAGAAAPAGATAADPNLHNVTSPLLGTYYRAPKPGAPPYVEVGSLVEEDTIIGIIEVMKLMNTVRAGVRGRVAEILARDGSLVEYGETVLRIARSG
jgi:acetyl-CoA carboxylase biotin carboxyl carrier protein